MLPFFGEFDASLNDFFAIAILLLISW